MTITQSYNSMTSPVFFSIYYILCRYIEEEEEAVVSQAEEDDDDGGRHSLFSVMQTFRKNGKMHFCDRHF